MVKAIYISGKKDVNNLSEATVKKFRKAEQKLIDDGWFVVNPASELFQQDIAQRIENAKEKWNQQILGEFNEYTWTLQLNMRYIAPCNAVYMLSDWQESPEATAEYYYAVACKKEIIFEEPINNNYD